MIVVRKSHERFVTRTSWLESRHTFSFGEHDDPARVGFRALRVLNDDLLAGNAGFPIHSHREMEILSYVLEGALEHRDSMGHGSIIRAGDVQRLSAGTGVSHSEVNPLSRECRFLQIWILPAERGLPPSYQQRPLDPAALQKGLCRVASPDGRDGALTVHQDVTLFAARPNAGNRLTHALAPGRHAWVQVARGDVTLNELALREGDGAGVSDEQALVIEAGERGAELLLFDLA